MSAADTSRWLDWVRRLQAVAHNGLHYANNPFDAERFEEVRAVAVELASLGPDEPEELARRFAQEPGHATPKLDVRGVIARGETVLLVRGTDDGKWTLPGGWAEVGETPSAAVEKEVRQEAGFEVRATGLIAILNRDVRHRPRFPFHGWKVYIRCEELAEGEPDGIETDAVGFFGADELPELSFRLPPEHLARVFAHVRDPSLPAELE
jgi:ADP-ribose pyrophosphatase YjhB (NUDIX family)